MQEVTFTLPASTVAAIVALADESGCLLDVGVTADNLDDLRESQRISETLLPTIETSRMVGGDML